MIKVELNGMESVTDMIQELSTMGSLISGAELRGVDRNDGNTSNEDIIGYLAEQNRDFASVSNQEAEEVAKEFAKSVEKTFAQRNKSAERVAKRRASGKTVTFKPIKTQSQILTSIAGIAMKKAMQKYMDIVEEKIRQGKIVNKRLSPSYDEWKEMTYGFSYPIGIATGQLIDNLNSSEMSKNIKILRNKSKSSIENAKRNFLSALNSIKF